MKAAVIYEAGGPEKLIYQEVSKPKVKPGWSLVKVKGFGINHSEIFTREGKSPTVAFPRILGIECVGEVVETTDEYRLPVNQRVISIMGEMGRDFDGSYAEYVLLPNNQIYPVNTHLDWKDLATMPETYSTAFGSMGALKVDESDYVLVRGASSGVGIAFMQLVKGKYPDIKIVGSTRNLKKAGELLRFGFDEVILDENNTLITDKKFNKILDLIGPVATKNSFKQIEAEGIVCSTGQLGGEWYLGEFDPIIDIPKSSYLTSFYSQNVTEQMINELLEYIERYDIRIHPEKIFSLAEIQKAHSYLESSQTSGKIVVLNEE